ncbi:hypothetical protein BZG36_05474 [Bifiguratus adelaidae]|uniref:J domain-containing protein n=1 Tax=Bifiguratus adelaidae TaxID=1938954 RepID=A0A261XSX1_9FUNG|nr:hypothetical protein BZG36_05474 [Bifiguratus adelaidae]
MPSFKALTPLLLAFRQPHSQSFCWTSSRYIQRFYAVRTHSHPLNPYETLSLHRTATIIDIRKRYYELCKKYHPDITGDKSPQARETFARINTAYRTLVDTNSRAYYDRNGASQYEGVVVDQTRYPRHYYDPPAHPNSVWDNPRFVPIALQTFLSSLAIMGVTLMLLTEPRRFNSKRKRHGHNER